MRALPLSSPRRVPQAFMERVWRPGMPGSGLLAALVEGQDGRSTPMEAALRMAGLVFHSLRPVDTDLCRRAVLGER